LLEQQGFDVIYSTLFARPTLLTEGEAGMANWIKMFASSFLTGLSSEQQIQVIRVTEEYLKPTLYQKGTWTADYRRIRIVAIKL
ncbi:MAG: SAM-dependent methyltransferase, partial [Nostoc sp.]